MCQTLWVVSLSNASPTQIASPGDETAERMARRGLPPLRASAECGCMGIVRRGAEPGASAQIDSVRHATARPIFTIGLPVAVAVVEAPRLAVSCLAHDR